SRVAQQPVARAGLGVLASNQAALAEDGSFRDTARIFLDRGTTRQRRHSTEANRALEQIAARHGITGRGWFERIRLVFSGCAHGDSVSPKARFHQPSDPFEAPTKPRLSGPGCSVVLRQKPVIRLSNE